MKKPDKYIKLTEKDFRLLETMYIHKITIGEKQGLFPRGGGQHRQFYKLQNHGFIKFDHITELIICDTKSNVAVFVLTSKGERAVKKHLERESNEKTR